VDLEEKKRRKRERARLAYWKQFEGKVPEEIEILREKYRLRNRESYRRCLVSGAKISIEERRARRRERDRARYHADREARRAKQRAENLTPEQLAKRRRTATLWREKNRERLAAYRRARYLATRPVNREAANKASLKYLKKRRDTDPEFRILHTLRARMAALLRRGIKQLKKAGRSKDLCGEGFFEHIQRELKPGMELTGIRTRKWHIDHVVPCSWFDMTRADHQHACFHWSNLQPEFACYNLSKADTCTCADVDRVLARCPEEFRPIFLEMRARAEREERVRKLSDES
jgi:uncharacterized protein YodC (DUF2158 family)